MTNQRLSKFGSGTNGKSVNENMTIKKNVSHAECLKMFPIRLVLEIFWNRDLRKRFPSADDFLAEWKYGFNENPAEWPTFLYSIAGVLAQNHNKFTPQQFYCVIEAMTNNQLYVTTEPYIVEIPRNVSTASFFRRKDGSMVMVMAASKIRWRMPDEE